MSIILGAYKFRGKAQAIRLMLEDAQVKYIERDVVNEDLDFGDPRVNPYKNLPWYMYDGERISDYMEIVFHVADKNDFVGTDEFEIGRIKITEEVAEEMRNNWEKLMYNGLMGYADRQAKYKETLDEKLAFLSKFLRDEIWFAGLTLTYVDFLLYELLDINKALFEDCLEPHTNIKDFMARFTYRYCIEKYMQSDRFIKKPLNAPRAAFDLYEMEFLPGVPYGCFDSD